MNVFNNRPRTDGLGHSIPVQFYENSQYKADYISNQRLRKQASRVIEYKNAHSNESCF